jgi:glycosyltransferase involved in cell wall biosynthesis
VAVLDHTAELGGAELALLRTCVALDPSRVEVTVVLFADGPLADRLRAVDVPVHVVPLDPRTAATDRMQVGRSVAGAARSAAATLPFVARLTEVLRGIGPDVVHTTSLKADLLGLPAAARARSPLVWHVHDRIAEDYLPAPVARALRVLARRGPRHVVVNSRATAETLLPLPRGWTLAYPGLAPEQVAADPASRAVPPEPVIGLVGRVSPTKGQREFVEACALLAPRFPTARFRVVGAALFAEAAYEAEVRALAERRGLGDRMEWTGWVADPARCPCWCTPRRSRSRSARWSSRAWPAACPWWRRRVAGSTRSRVPRTAPSAACWSRRATPRRSRTPSRGCWTGRRRPRRGRTARGRTSRRSSPWRRPPSG